MPSDVGPRCWPCWTARLGWKPSRFRWIRQNGEVVLLCDICFQGMAQLALDGRIEAPRKVTDVATPMIEYRP